MNKKKFSPSLKKIYKPFQAVFGFSLASGVALNLIQMMIVKGGIVNPVIETIGFIFIWICVAFGYLGIWYILPIILSATLIFISVAWAISDKNIKNVFNLNLLITIALIFVGSVLPYNWLILHF